MSSGNESYFVPMSKETLEDSPGGGQSHQSVSMREASYKICGHIKLIQAEWKGALLSTQNMGKGLHKLFKTVDNDISQAVSNLGESRSEISYFIPEPRNFAEEIRLLYYIKVP